MLVRDGCERASIFGAAHLRALDGLKGRLQARLPATRKYDGAL